MLGSNTTRSYCSLYGNYDNKDWMLTSFITKCYSIKINTVEQLEKTNWKRFTLSSKTAHLLASGERGGGWGGGGEKLLAFTNVMGRSCIYSELNSRSEERQGVGRQACDWGHDAVPTGWRRILHWQGGHRLPLEVEVPACARTLGLSTVPVEPAGPRY